MPGRHAAPGSLATGRGRLQPNRHAGGAPLVALGVVAALGGAVAAHLRRVEVRGPSMEPTLEDGDRLLCGPVLRLRPGDLVVIEEPGGHGLLAVKRVAACGRDGVVVLGDNPAASRDSRAYGAVPRSAVRGRAWWRYHPAARAGRLQGRTPGAPA